MPQCPSCGTELNADFGMVACPTCRAISVIDMDGNIQLEPEDVPGPPAGLGPEVISFEPAPSEFAPLDPVPGEPTPIDSTAIDPTAVDSTAIDSSSFDFAPPPEPAIFSDQKANNDLSSIADFGNSPESVAKDGMFVFDVMVSGIDTKELRDAVRESISDSRFLWDINEIMSQVSRGSLVIRQLNPVKATILINRLKGLPLEIQWKQNAIISG